MSRDIITGWGGFDLCAHDLRRKARTAFVELLGMFRTSMLLLLCAFAPVGSAFASELVRLIEKADRYVEGLDVPALLDEIERGDGWAMDATSDTITFSLGDGREAIGTGELVAFWRKSPGGFIWSYLIHEGGKSRMSRSMVNYSYAVKHYAKENDIPELLIPTGNKEIAILYLRVAAFINSSKYLVRGDTGQDFEYWFLLDKVELAEAKQ